jgi:hypothetical protein
LCLDVGGMSASSLRLGSVLSWLKVRLLPLLATMLVLATITRPTKACDVVVLNLDPAAVADLQGGATWLLSTASIHPDGGAATRSDLPVPSSTPTPLSWGMLHSQQAEGVTTSPTSSPSGGGPGPVVAHLRPATCLSDPQLVVPLHAARALVLLPTSISSIFRPPRVGP